METPKKENKYKTMVISSKDGGQIYACSCCFTEVADGAIFCHECGENIEDPIYGEGV